MINEFLVSAPDKTNGDASINFLRKSNGEFAVDAVDFENMTVKDLFAIAEQAKKIEAYSSPTFCVCACAQHGV
jgi:hypothetical protein